MNKYIHKIDDFINQLNEQTQLALLSLPKQKVYEKGVYLLKEGQICKKSFALESGIIRKFYVNDGKEITTEFYFKDDIALSFKSYISQEPSNEYLQVLEKTVVMETDYKDVQKSQNAHPELIELELMFMQQYVIWLDERLFHFHTLDAKQKYELILNKSPHIIQNIPLNYISSYLGVSPETISRIRASK